MADRGGPLRDYRGGRPRPGQLVALASLRRPDAAGGSWPFGLFRLTVELGVLLALVVLGQRGRYGGPVRTAEWLALGLASLAVVNLVPTWMRRSTRIGAVGSTALDFGVRAGCSRRPRLRVWFWSRPG